VPALRLLRRELPPDPPDAAGVPVAAGVPGAAGAPVAAGVPGAAGATRRIGLLVVEAGPYSGADVARSLDTDVVATLPADPRTAQRLSTGGAPHPRSALLRAAATVRLDAAPREVPGAA